MSLWGFVTNNLDAIATIIVGGIGFFWHSYSGKKFMRRQHTFDVVMQSVTDNVFQKRLKSIRVYFEDFNGNDTDRKDPKNWDDTSEDSDLRAVLNHMEALAAALKYKDLDEKLFRETYRGIVIKLYETFEYHIHAHRKNKKSQKSFEHLEWLYDKWIKITTKT